jgi:hypothetical protein
MLLLTNWKMFPPCAVGFLGAREGGGRQDFLNVSFTEVVSNNIWKNFPVACLQGDDKWMRSCFY